MKLDKAMTIAEVQKGFAGLYPGLRIEFYAKEHKDHSGSALKDQYSNSLTIGEITEGKVDGEINFGPERTVADIEGEFEDRFDLHVQIFRRSNTLWLQTSATDDWTLEVQNRKGLHSTQ